MNTAKSEYDRLINRYGPPVKSSAYIVQHLTLTTYSGKRIPMEVIGKEIQKMPQRVLKEKILDQFGGMKMPDPVVRVELKVRHI